MALTPVTPGTRIKSFPAELYNGAIRLLDKDKGTHTGFESDDESKDVWVVLKVANVVTANAKWDYDCKEWFEDHDSTDWVGGFEGPDTFKARNCFERGTKGYYTASNVTGIKPLPLNKPFRATRVTCSAGVIFRLDEANEPICS